TPEWSGATVRGRERSSRTAYGCADQGRLAVLVEGQDLQLGGQVHLAQVDVRRDGQHHRREVQHAGHASGDDLVAHLLRHRSRGGEYRDRDLVLGDERVEV